MRCGLDSPLIGVFKHDFLVEARLIDGELGLWFSLDPEEFCNKVAEALRVVSGSEKWK
jgi:hypothetical protein